MTNPKNKPKGRKKRLNTEKNKFIIQRSGKDYTMSDIKEVCMKAFRSEANQKVDPVDIYLKAENGNIRAYYVINGIADAKYINL